MDRKWKSKWLVALAGLAMFSLVMAAEQAPSGTIKLTSKSVAVGVGVGSRSKVAVRTLFAWTSSASGLVVLVTAPLQPTKVEPTLPVAVMLPE